MNALLIVLYFAVPAIIESAHLNASCETNNNCDTPFAICSSEKICQCHNSYQMTNNICRLKTLYAGLGDSCAQSSDCKIAFSTCEDGICTCRPSFRAVDGLCKSANFCPYTNKMKQIMSIEYCIIIKYNIKEMEHEGNCSKGFHCFWHRGAYTPSYERLGVCCPKCTHHSPNFHMVCPQGEIAASNVTCLDQFRIQADEINPTVLDTCYSDRTHCIYSKKKYACCTKPCIDSAMNIGGRCYGHVSAGGFCDHDAQCPEHGKCSLLNEAKNHKICECPFGVYDDERCSSKNMTEGDSDDEEEEEEVEVK